MTTLISTNLLSSIGPLFGILGSLFTLLVFFIGVSTSTVKTFESIVVDLLLFFRFHIFNNRFMITDYFTYYLWSTLKGFKFLCLASFCGRVEYHTKSPNLYCVPIELRSL